MRTRKGGTVEECQDSGYSNVPPSSPEHHQVPSLAFPLSRELVWRAWRERDEKITLALLCNNYGKITYDDHQSRQIRESLVSRP